MAGSMTLLMALAVLAAWGRSQIRQESIMSPLLPGGIQYQACLLPSGFCFKKSQAITIGDQETLSCRNGKVVISAVNDDFQTHQPNGSPFDGFTGMRVIALTNPSVSFTNRRPPHYGNPVIDILQNPNPNGIGVEEMELVSISGPTTVFVDCGQAVIPYWYLITPLTLISAYLLLTKSRVSEPKQPFASSAGKGA